MYGQLKGSGGQLPGCLGTGRAAIGNPASDAVPHDVSVEMGQSARNEHFDTWPRARVSLEQEYRRVERSVQDYCLEANADSKKQACQHPPVVARSLAGTSAKDKDEADQEKHPFQNGR